MIAVEDLHKSFGSQRVLNGITLAVGRGETLSVVGESGCGKTVTAMTVLKLIAMPPGQIVAGRILWKGRDLVPLGVDEMQHIRSKEIAIIFQEPMTSLNPVYTVGDQIAEVVRLHQGVGRREAMDRAIEMLRLVHVPAPDSSRRVRISSRICAWIVTSSAVVGSSASSSFGEHDSAIAIITRWRRPPDSWCG